MEASNLLPSTDASHCIASKRMNYDVFVPPSIAWTPPRR
jgi:hypothetical protein